MPSGSIDIARRLAVLGLLVVASGWRPRITGVLHWWLSYSFVASATIQDGGDQVAAIVALLLIPWTVTDHRRWHWERPADPRGRGRPAIVVHACHALIRIQVAVVYFQSSISKFGVSRWSDGTAFYYWAHHPVLGVPPWIRSVMFPALGSPIVVAAFTWGPLVVEFALALAFFVRRKWWPMLLAIGIVFHVLIALLVGAASFSVAMIGVLILYLRPPEAEFGWPRRLLRIGRIVEGPGTSPGPSKVPAS